MLYFRSANYFGVLADTGRGPQNFIDVHPRLQIQPVRGVSVSADCVAQWRQNLHDGVYAVPGFCSSRPTAATLASSAIGPEWKFVGKLIVTLTFRRIMVFFTPASS